MSDPNPPQPFNWNLPPKKPEDGAEPAVPVYPPAQPPAAAPPPQWPAATQPPAPPSAPAWPPAAQQAPPPPPIASQPPQWPPASQPPVQQPAPAWPPAGQQAPPPPAPPAATQPPQWPATTQPPAYPPVQQPAPAWPPAAQQAAPPQPPPAPWPAATEPPTQGAPAFPTGSYGYPPTAPQQPPAAPPRPTYEDVPTQAIAYDPFATQAFPFDGALSGATEVLGAQPVGLPDPRDESRRPQQASAIDSLFGESQFKEYEASAFPSEGISALASSRPREPREPLGTTQKVLLAVGGSLVGLLALVGLFMLGTKLPALFPPAAEPAAVQTIAPPVPAQPVVLGPVAAGAHPWDDLLGTECLDPYVSAWQEEYTVVDCSAPHAAQMVYHGYFGDEAWAPYPGLAELQSRINLLCTSPSTVDYAVASQFSDIQVAASYAATEEEWAAGERDYYCFVSRSSTEPLTASVANAIVPVEGLTATVPGNDP